MTHTVVSLVPGYTEALFALGLGERVLAVSHECDFPAAAAELPRATVSSIPSDLGSAAIDEEVKRLLAAGQPLYQLDRALLKGLRPDCIVVQSQCEVCAVDDVMVRSWLRDVPELKETQVFSVKPATLNDMFDDFQQLGQLLGVADLAATFVAQCRARLPQPTADQRPRVLCIEWLEPIMLAANMAPELIERAGGISGIAKPQSKSIYHSWDEIVAYDPDVLIVAPCGFNEAQTRNEFHLLTQRPGWSTLRAVVENRVHIMDGNAYLHRYGPRLVDSINIIADWLVQ